MSEIECKCREIYDEISFVVDGYAAISFVCPKHGPVTIDERPAQQPRSTGTSTYVRHPKRPDANRGIGG